MESKRGHHMGQLWADHETDIAKKVTSSTEVTLGDMRRAVTAAASKPTAQLPDSVFLHALGTPDVNKAPPQTGSLVLRATEEWERCICENKAFAILNRTQARRSAIIKKDGGEMLVAIVVDKPLAAVNTLVDDPPTLIAEITRILKDKQSRPVIAQMVNPDVRDDLPISEFQQPPHPAAAAAHEDQSNPMSSKTDFSEIV